MGRTDGPVAPIRKISSANPETRAGSGYTIARSGDFLRMSADAAKLAIAASAVSSAAFPIGGHSSGCKTIAQAIRIGGWIR